VTVRPWLTALAGLALTGCSVAAAPSEGSAPVDATPSPAVSASPAPVAHQAASQVEPERPRHVTLPSGRVMGVDVVGTGADGALEIPVDIRRAGWWDGGSRLGDPFGSVVLAAHVDSFTQGLGPAVELLSAEVGEHVRLAAAHLTQDYRVTSVRLVPRFDLRHQTAVFSALGGRRLALITCGGTYDKARGGYQDNVVVLARPVGPLRPTR